MRLDQRDNMRWVWLVAQSAFPSSMELVIIFLCQFEYLCRSLYHELIMSAAKERPTVHHSAQWHSQKYLDHHYLIRKMVVMNYAVSDLPGSMYMATQRDHRGYSLPS